MNYQITYPFHYIPFPEHRSVGRKPVKLRDKIFYLTLQAYNIKSSRRCISDLEIAKKLKYIDNAPHFNTVLKCLNDPNLLSYFKHLINVSGLPLQQVENDFAVDSSGFSTSQFDRWFEARNQKKNIEKKNIVQIFPLRKIQLENIGESLFYGEEGIDIT